MPRRAGPVTTGDVGMFDRVLSLIASVFTTAMALAIAGLVLVKAGAWMMGVH